MALLKALHILGGVIDKHPNVPATTHILCAPKLLAGSCG
jgi:hypothetical protein